MSAKRTAITTVAVLAGILIIGFTLNAVFLKAGIIGDTAVVGSIDGSSTANGTSGDGSSTGNATDTQDAASDTGSNLSDTAYVTSTGETLPNSALIDVAVILQNPELPTGCEITSLTMVLNYYGYKVDKVDMADDYLPKGEGSFWDMFYGNPQDTTGLGCYAEAIVSAANNYFSANNISRKAVNISGTNFNDILKLVADGTPVVIWNTMDMQEAKDMTTYTYNGETYTWKSPEHCVVIKGYNLTEGVVYVSDPTRGSVARSLSLFKQRYEDIYSQAVCIQ